MAIKTAERVSRDVTDNFVFQRSKLAYVEAAKRVGGRVLEIGTGTGYGIDIIAPNVEHFVTIDKTRSEELGAMPANVEFVESVVPPLPFADESFDYVVSFQVIEHIKRDKEFVSEVRRVLKKGGKFIVSTPNRPMSLTRNPWHVREYTAEQFGELLSSFTKVEAMGVAGMIIFPIAAISIKKLNDSGLIHLWKREDTNDRNNIQHHSGNGYEHSRGHEYPSG